MDYSGENSLKKIFTLMEENLARKVHEHNYAGSASPGGAATSANKVNKSLTVKLNGGNTEGTNKYTFDGSGAKSINLTPGSIGAQAKAVSVVATLTVAGWSNKTQTVTVSGVTASNIVYVAPDSASHKDYADAEVICTAQAANQLTFTCENVPTTKLTVNVVIL